MSICPAIALAQESQNPIVVESPLPRIIANPLFKGACIGGAVAVTTNIPDVAIARIQVGKTGASTGLFAGLKISFITQMVKSIGLIGSMDYCRELVKNSGVENPTAAHFLTVGAASCVELAVSYPLSLVNTKIKGGACKTAREVMVALPETGRIKAIYNGVGTAFLRNMSFNVPYFYFADTIRGEVSQLETLQDYPFTQSIIAGQSAGMVSTISSIPLAIISTNQRFYGISACEATKRIFQENGVKGFYRGFFICQLRMGLMGATIAGTQEILKKL